MLYNESRVELVFFQTEMGRQPVQEALDDLSKPDRARVLSYLSMLEQHGQSLKEPHVKPLREKLKELRFQVRPGQFRIFFFFHAGDKAVLVHSLIKKTQQTPKQDLALSRMRHWNRVNGG